MTQFNPFSLSGKHILVTGASSGIGREVAIWLSQQGAIITLAARDTSRLESTLERMQGSGHNLEVIDFLGGADVPQWLKSVAKVSSPFDGLVHAAGVQMPMPIRATSIDHWEKIMSTNDFRVFIDQGVSPEGCLQPGLEYRSRFLSNGTSR